MVVHLAVESSGTISPASSSFDFENGTITIGRAASNDWVLKDPDQVISKTHCELVADETGVSIVDRSTNGVFLNGSSVPIGRGNGAHLKSGDRFQVGEYVIRVKLEERQSADFLGSPFEPSAVEESTEILPAASPGPGFDRREPLAPDSHAASGAGPDPLGLDEEPAAEDLFAKPASSDHVPFDAEFMPAPRTQSEVEDPLGTAASEAPRGRKDILPDDLGLDDLLGPQGESSPPLEESSNALPEQGLPADFDAGLDKEPLTPPEADLPDQSDRSAAQPSTQEYPPESIAGESVARGSSETETSGSSVPAYGNSDQASLFDTFLKSAGIKSDAMLVDAERMAQQSGVLFRKMLEGLVVLLQARMVVKNEYQLERTLLRPIANNPLKSLPSVDEVLAVLYRAEGSTNVWLDAESAVNESIQDLKSHDLALVAGMNAVVEYFFSALEPDRFAETGQGDRKKLLSISALEKAKHWDKFQAAYASLKKNLEDGLTGEARAIFERAYNREKQRLEG